MKLSKRIIALGITVILEVMSSLSVYADNFDNNSNNDAVLMSSLAPANVTSFTNTMTPASTLVIGNTTFTDSIHYNYNLSYTHAKATPYFYVTVPANSGSGYVQVEFYYVHQGAAKYHAKKKVNFSNSSSSQVIYLTKVASSEFSVNGSSNTDVYARFKATTNNSNMSGKSVYASLAINYY